MHQQAKLRRWAIAILLIARTMAIGGGLQVRPTLRQRHPLDLVRAYDWTFLSPGQIQGVGTNSFIEQRNVILLEQESDGLHWVVAGDNIENRQTATDCQTLLQSAEARGIVFHTRPFLHGLPWSVPDSIANKHVLMALKQQPF